LIRLCIICLVLPTALARAEPRLALVLDTSGSMADNDPRRSAVHFAKVMARVLGDGVGVTALYPRGTDCSAGEAAVATVARDPADPGAFDRALEDGVRYAGGNMFGPPIARARTLLGPPASPAVLAILADGGGRSGAERRTTLDAEIARRVTAAGGRHDDVDVRVSLKWNTTDDLDLHVTAPSGEQIFHGNRNSRDGGVLDVDLNVGGGTRQPVENVRWAKGHAPVGTYRVMVQNYSFNESARLPIDFVVEIVNGGEVKSYRGTLTGAGETKVVAEFSYDPNRRVQPADTGAVGDALARQDAALNPTSTGCPDPWADLTTLKGAGTTLVSVALGGNGSPFAGHQLMGNSLRIGSAAELAATAAALAKDQFGRDRLRPGAGTGRVEIQVPEHTGQVWLLVTADGPLTELRASPSNPAAAKVKLDEAAGATHAADGRGLIAYRVIRLVDPAAGTWRFETGAGLALGWLVETRGQLGLRLVEPPALFLGHQAKLVLEVFDPRSGRVLADPALLRSLTLSASFDGADTAFNDRGQAPDQTAADARFSALVQPSHQGPVALKTRLRYDGMEREQVFPLQVAETAWRWRPALPATHRRDTPLLVSGTIEPVESRRPQPPTSITATAVDLVLRLRDDGRDGDQSAGDRVYSARWTPTQSGAVRFSFAGQGGAPLEAADATVTVIDWALLKGSDLLDFGVLGSGEQGHAVLDLSTSSVHGEVPLVLTAGGVVEGLTLEIEDGSGRRRLTAGESVDLVLGSATKTWRLSLTAARCPPAVNGGDTGSVQVRTRSGDGPDQRLDLRLRVATTPLAWFVCLLPFLILAALLLLAAFVVWGFVSPARFPRTLGVVLSPEEDLNEGFLQLVRARKGTGSGFYRDARCFITADFRLSGKRNGALVGLVAGRPRPRFKLLDGQPILRRNPEGAWEPLGETDSLVQFGELYRNEAATLYFELRNA